MSCCRNTPNQGRYWKILWVSTKHCEQAGRYAACASTSAYAPCKDHNRAVRAVRKALTLVRETPTEAEAVVDRWVKLASDCIGADHCQTGAGMAG